LSTATETRERGAPSGPRHLSLREWPDVFRHTLKRFIADDCTGLAQQVAFSALLAFIPSVVLLIGLLGLFGNGTFDSVERFVGSVAPHGVVSMIDLARKDAAGNKSGSAIALAAGVLAALWAASGAMGAVIKAVNRAYEEVETRPFWKVRLIALFLVCATGLVTAGMFLLIVFGGSLGDAIVRRTALGDSFKTFWDIARWPIAFAAVLLFFAFVYHLAPDTKQRWRWISPGSLVGSLMWLVLSGMFALYTSFSGSYDRTYGSLAGAIVLLLWLNYSAWAILFGAELNGELDRRRARAPRPR
jgi:membrane protein